MTVEDVNFLDLIILLKITPNMVLEKIGSLINASIFDASNLAGGLKQKGLIDFSASFPDPTTIHMTDAGKALLAEAETKASEPFDKLDEEVLQQLSGGKRMPGDLQSALNLRAKDLALRLYKLSKQGFLTYEPKNGAVFLMMTEQGFLRAKVEQKVTPPGGAAQAQAMQQPQATMQSTPGSIPQLEIPQHGEAGVSMHEGRKGRGGVIAAIIVIIILIIFVIYTLQSRGIITI